MAKSYEAYYSPTYRKNIYDNFPTGGKVLYLQLSNSLHLILNLSLYI